MAVNTLSISSTVTLYTGSKMPIFGLGTWQSKVGEVYTAVEHALANGYRHIDCAYVYSNEKEIGKAITDSIKKGVVQRKDLWITSKLWNTHHEPQHVRQAVEATLSFLQVDYLDLYLIHWPHGFQFNGSFDCTNNFPANEDGSIKYNEDVDYVDTWKELEKLVDEGKIKNLGFSNFNSQQIQRILDVARIKPAVLQVECHPYLNQEKLFQFCKERHIALTAYSPLGSPTRPWAKGEDPSLLDDPVVKKIAEKHKKSPAQVLIRYPLERGIIVIPKSTTPARIVENSQVFDFQLDKEDLDALLSINANRRYTPLTRDIKHKHYPFHTEF